MCVCDPYQEGPQQVIAILNISGCSRLEDSDMNKVGHQRKGSDIVSGIDPVGYTGIPCVVQEATELGKRAKEIKDAALVLQREERAGGKGRKWKKNVHKVQQVQARPSQGSVFFQTIFVGPLQGCWQVSTVFSYIFKIVTVSYIYAWSILQFVICPFRIMIILFLLYILYSSSFGGNYFNECCRLCGFCGTNLINTD